MGADNLDRNGKDVQEGGSPDIPEKEQSNGMFTGVCWAQQGAAAYKRRTMVEGSTFWGRKRTRVSYAECGGTMAESSLCHYMERSHCIVLPYTRGLNFGGAV